MIASACSIRPQGESRNPSDLMRAGNAARAGFSVQAIGERIAQSLDATARARLRFEHDDFVASARQLVRRDESRESCPKNDYAFGRAAPLRRLRIKCPRGDALHQTAGGTQCSQPKKCPAIEHGRRSAPS